MDYVTLASHADYHRLANSPLMTAFPAALETFLNTQFDTQILLDALQQSPAFSELPEALSTPFDIIEYLQGPTFLATTQDPESEKAKVALALQTTLDQFCKQHQQHASGQISERTALARLIMQHRNYMDLYTKLSEMRILLAKEQQGETGDDSVQYFLRASTTSLQMIYESFKEQIAFFEASSSSRDQAICELLNDTCAHMEVECQALVRHLEMANDPSQLDSQLAVIEGIRQSIQAGNPDTKLLTHFMASEHCRALMKLNPRFAAEVQSVNHEVTVYIADALWAEYQACFLQIDQDELDAFGREDKANHPAISRSTDLSQQLGFSIQAEILSYDDIAARTLAFERWLRIASTCVQQKNYMAAEQIYFALRTSSLFRLKATATGLSDEAKGIYESLGNLFRVENNHFPNYNALVAGSSDAYIPLINMYQSRMTFAEVRRKAGDTDLAAKQKLKVFEEVTARKYALIYQAKPGNPESGWRASILNTECDAAAEGKLYERSRAIEDDDTIVSDIMTRHANTLGLKVPSDRELLQSLKTALSDKNARVALKVDSQGVLGFQVGGHNANHHSASKTRRDIVVASRLLQLIRDNFDDYIADGALPLFIAENEWLAALVATNTHIKLLYKSILQLSKEAKARVAPVVYGPISDVSKESRQVGDWVETLLKSRDAPAEEWVKADVTGYGYTQYNYLGDDTNICGSNTVAEVRFFTEESYHGAKVEDFIARANALTQVALTRAAKLPEAQASELSAWIQNEFEKTRKRLSEQCIINANNHLAETQAKAILTARSLLRQLLVDLVTATDPDALTEKGITKSAISAFQSEEAQWLAAEGRPNFVHVYQLPSDIQTDTNYRRVSAQETMGDHTNPSTLRDKKELSNFIRVACGAFDAASGQYRQDFFAYRHSSYSPIQYKGTSKSDSFMHRRDGAAKSARQMLQTLVEAKLADLPADEMQTGPIEISLSSMMMLSPSWFMDHGKMSEDRQVEESFHALQMLNGRVLDITIATEHGDRVVQVKPDFSQMNAPANAKASPFLVYSKSMVNERGFYDYQSSMLAFLNQNPIETNTPMGAAKLELVEIAVQSKAFLEQQAKHPDIIQAERRLQVKLAQANLPALYARLENLQLQYQHCGSDADKKSLYKQYKHLDKQIQKRQKHVAKAYAEVNRVRRKNRQKHCQESMNLLHNAITAALGNASLQDWFKSENGRDLRDQLTAFQLYLDALTLQDNHLQESYEFAHDFQARYLLSNNLIGRNVEMFCKSGKDRTGRVQNYIEEMLSYRDIYGSVPRLNEESQQRLEAISGSVHEFSVSREIAHHNAHGARGLLQDAGNRIARVRLRVNRALNILTDRAMGSLAKRHIYERGTKMPANYFAPDAVAAVIEPTQSMQADALSVLHKAYEDLKQQVHIGSNGIEPHASKLAQNRQALRQAFDRLYKVVQQLRSDNPSVRVDAIYEQIIQDRYDPKLALHEGEHYVRLPKPAELNQIAYDYYRAAKEALFAHYYRAPEDRETLNSLFHDYDQKHTYLKEQLEMPERYTAEETLLQEQMRDEMIADYSDTGLVAIYQMLYAKEETAQQTVEQSVDYDALIASILNPGLRQVLKTNTDAVLALASQENIAAKIIRFNSTVQRDEDQLTQSLSELGLTTELVDDVLRLVIFSAERSHCQLLWQISSRAVQNFILDNPHCVDLAALTPVVVRDLNEAKSREAVFAVLDATGLIDLSDDGLRAQFDSKLDTLSDSQQRLIQSAYFINPEIKRMIEQDQRIPIPISYAEHKDAILAINQCTFQAYDRADLADKLSRIFGDPDILNMNRHESMSGEVVQSSTPLQRIDDANLQLQDNDKVKRVAIALEGHAVLRSTYESLQAESHADRLSVLYKAVQTASTGADHLSALQAYQAAVSALSQLKTTAIQTQIALDLLGELHDSIELGDNEALVQICALQLGITDLNNQNLKEITLQAITAKQQELSALLLKSHQAEAAIYQHQKQFMQLAEVTFKVLKHEAKAQLPKSPERKRRLFGRARKQEAQPLLQSDLSTLRSTVAHEQAQLQTFHNIIDTLHVPELDSRPDFQIQQKAKLSVLRGDAETAVKRVDKVLSDYADPIVLTENDAPTEAVYANPFTQLVQASPSSSKRASVSMGSDYVDLALLETVLDETTRDQLVPVDNRASEQTQAQSVFLHKDSSFAQLQSRFADFDLNYRKKVISYNSRLSGMDPAAHRAHPKFTTEKEFIIEAIITLIQDRKPSKRHKPVVLGGHDQTLIDESYCVVKAMGYEVQFEEGCQITLNPAEVASKQSEYAEHHDIISMKHSMTQALRMEATPQA